MSRGRIANSTSVRVQSIRHRRQSFILSTIFGHTLGRTWPSPIAMARSSNSAFRCSSARTLSANRRTVSGASKETTLNWKHLYSQQAVVLMLSLLLAVGFAAFLPAFATVLNIIALLQNVAILGILALGMG